MWIIVQPLSQIGNNICPGLIMILVCVSCLYFLCSYLKTCIKKATSNNSLTAQRTVFIISSSRSLWLFVCQIN